MKINYYIAVFIIFLFSLGYSNSIDTEELLLSKMEILNVSYGISANQKYDAYLPERRNSSTTKVLLLVHGDGWIEGINYEDGMEFYKSVSPFHRVQSSSPPTLLFYGTENPIIPF